MSQHSADDESGYEESGYDVDIESMTEIEPDPDYDEVSSQYDSCYSSGTSVILSDSSARILSKANLISRRGLDSDNTTTLFSEVTNFKWEHGRRLAPSVTEDARAGGLMGFSADIMRTRKALTGLLMTINRTSSWISCMSCTLVTADRGPHRSGCR
jgi:hypothetical protein